MFTMKYRDRDEIFTCIIHTTGLNGARITKIMYSSFLSYTQVLGYLTTMVEMGFLNYDRADKLFKVTSKGIRYLSIREKLCEILNISSSTINIKHWENTESCLKPIHFERWNESFTYIGIRCTNSVKKNFIDKYTVKNPEEVAFINRMPSQFRRC
jgi:predicted transcriptional regulator